MGPPQPSGRLLLGNVQLLNQRLDGGSLLHKIQITSLDIFNQCKDRRVACGDIAYNSGNIFHSGLLAGDEAPLPRNNIIQRIAFLPQRNRLKEAIGGNAFRKGTQFPLMERLTGLVGIRLNILHGDQKNFIDCLALCKYAHYAKPPFHLLKRVFSQIFNTSSEKIPLDDFFFSTCEKEYAAGNCNIPLSTFSRVILLYHSVFQNSIIFHRAV